MMKENKAARAMGYIGDDLVTEAGRERRPNMKKNIWIRWTAIAAMFVLVLTGGVAVMLSASGGGAIVALDVNPSIELEINRREEVKEIRALNPEAETVIGTMDLEGVDLDVAINAIIGSMVTNGYLTEAKNSILVSINTKDASKAAALQEKLSGEINTLLGESQIEASVITQRFMGNSETDKRAEENNISRAKATLISRIVESELLDANGVPYTYEALAAMKVHELKMLLEARDWAVDGTQSSGIASGKGYINKAEAKEAALAAAGLLEADVRHMRIELDYDGDVRAMVYEVEFYAGNTEYEFEIDAVSGRVLEQDRGDAEDEPEDDAVIVPPEGCISREEALAIAYADAGIGAGQVKRPEIELDREGGLYVYEIEFKAAGQEYEYTVDAVTGAILERDVERDD